MRSAIGFDQKRGDQVEVVNLRFAETPANPIVEPTGWLSMLHFTKDDIMRMIEMLVMGVLGLVVLLFVVRPLVRRIIAPEERGLRLCRPAPRRRRLAGADGRRARSPRASRPAEPADRARHRR